MSKFFIGLLTGLALVAGMLIYETTTILAKLNTNGEIINVDKTLQDGQFLDLPKNEGVIKLETMKNQFFCTGFVISPNFAITAGHCLNQDGKLHKEPIKVFNSLGLDTSVRAKAAGFMTRNDFGLLMGDFKDFKAVKVEMEKFTIIPGKLYKACGFPYGQHELACNPFVPIRNYGFFMAGPGYLVPGQSGGPVIDPETGVVVGLNTAALEEGLILITPLQGIAGAFGLD